MLNFLVRSLIRNREVMQMLAYVCLRIVGGSPREPCSDALLQCRDCQEQLQNGAFTSDTKFSLQSSAMMLSRVASWCIRYEYQPRTDKAESADRNFSPAWQNSNPTSTQ
jgi:hypothetical protein